MVVINVCVTKSTKYQNYACYICYMDFGDKSTGWTRPLRTEKCVDPVNARLHPCSYSDHLPPET